MALGGGGARHAAMGRPAVRTVWVLAIAAPGLAACSSIGSITGAVTGAAAGGGSVNPAVGYAVGIGTKAATDSLVHYLSRSRHAHEQDVLATAAGALPPGASTAWAIHHRFPLFDDAHGQVTVTRDIPNALSPCKEVVFLLRGGKRDTFLGAYTTSVCQGSTGWRWASAEPATRRWSFLQ